MKTLSGKSLALAAVASATALLLGYTLAGETPSGRIKGILVAADSGRPLPHVTVALRPADANDTGGRWYQALTGPDGAFSFPAVAEGLYKMSATTRAHKDPGRAFQVVEGQTIDDVVELQPTDPFIERVGGDEVFTPDEQPVLRVQGFVPVPALTLRIYSLSEQAAIHEWRSWLPGIHGVRHNAIRRGPLEAAEGLTLVRTRTVPVRGRDVEGVFRQDLRLEPLPPGMYALSVEGTPAAVRTLFTVTDLAVIVKYAGSEALVYASDLKTGAPAAGTPIELMSLDDTVARAVTGTDGRATLPLNRLRRAAQAAVVARRGDSIAVATFDVGESSEDDALVYTVTDRPAYRPGDTVHIKSILRSRAGTTLRPPDATEVRLTVRDGAENIVHRADLKTDEFGAASDSFVLDPAAPPGYYTVSISKDGRPFEHGFQVAAYRKPEFSVKVTPSASRLVAGGKAVATIAATYYFGAPVADAPVSVTITREPASYYEPDPWDSDGEMTEPAPPRYGGDYYGGEEFVADLSGRTDSQGRFRVSVPTRRPDELDPVDYRYVVRAWVTDSAGRQMDGEASILATQGEYRLEAALDTYVGRPGRPLTVLLKAVDYEGRPVPGVSGKAEIFRRVWERNHERREKKGEASWSADAEGRATLELKPNEPGDYVILASTEDRTQRVCAAAYAWVMAGESAEFDYPYGSLDMRADRKQYGVGETAQLVINTRTAPQSALLTLEGNRIVESRVVRLNAKTTLVRIPVSSSMMPAVRASVSFFRNKEYVSAEATLNVSRSTRALKVELTSTKPVYLPGERITYSIRTLRPDGSPVQAQVALGVVDEALYALYPDTSPNITAAFYPRRLYSVNTVYSYPRVYLSGDDKSGPGLAIRRRFADTAYWNPSVVTDANGRASVSFTLPDNLTTWRATARAVTKDTLAGQSLQTVVVQKPVMIRLQPPRFLTQGDRFELLASGTNLKTEELHALVTLERDALKMDGAALRKLDIRSGATATTGWWVTAMEPGTATVRAMLNADRTSDAVESVIPIVPRGRLRRDGVALVVAPEAAATLNVRADAVPGTPRLTLHASPTLLTSLLSSLESLAAYPYGCTEQTVSSFLPDIGIASLAARHDIAPPEFQSRVGRMVRSGIVRLAASQGPGGGWGWWNYDAPDPWMTAYAAFSLITARDAGYEVSPQVIERAVDAIAVQASARTSPHDARAFGAWVLALQDRPEADTALNAFAGSSLWRRRHLSDWGLAMLALAEDARGRRDDARGILRQLWSRFSGPGYRPLRSRTLWYSDADYAAAFLLAACRITPDHADLSRLARRLVDYRRGEGWSSTRDTAFAVMALTRYADLTGELEPDNEVVIQVNGREVGRKRFTSRDLLNADYVVTLPTLPPGPLRLQATSRGRGRAYLVASLEQYTNGSLDSPVTSESGLVVQRQYSRVSRGSGWAFDGGTGSRGALAFRSGDIVEVTLTVRTPQPCDYVMVEDPFPAGFEPQDRGQVDTSEWTDWWCAQVVRDDRVGFAIRHLDKGARTIKYRVRARTRGTFTALPPSVFDMYNPEARGEGTASAVTVR